MKRMLLPEYESCELLDRFAPFKQQENTQRL